MVPTALADPARRSTERRQLDAFLRTSGLACVVLDDQGERPDFILGWNGQRVGLEVTGLTDEQKERTTDAMKMVAAQVEARLSKSRLNVLLDVTWQTETMMAAMKEGGRRRGFELDPKAVASLAGRLGDAASTMYRSGQEVWEHDRLVEFGLPEVYALTLWPDDEPHMSSSETRFGNGDVTEVQRAIDLKDRKLSGYRARVGGPVWLLLVTGSRMSENLVLWLLDAGHAFQTKFDRVFILEETVGEVRELHLVRRMTDGG